MKFAKEAKIKFLNGSFGKCFPERLLDNMLNKINEEDADSANVDFLFTHGASNHSEEVRAEEDFYATDPSAVEALMKVEKFSHNVFEPACGEGHIAKVLESHGYKVLLNDIVKRNYGEYFPGDFLTINSDEYAGMDIVTNPPYKMAAEFVEYSMDTVTYGHKVAMFLKLTFLEGQGRKKLFDKYPPKRIWVFRKRVNCGRNGKFDDTASAVCYAWFIWEKGYSGIPEIHWID